MATDYFACVRFGVKLEGDLLTSFSKKYGEAERAVIERWAAENDFDGDYDDAYECWADEFCGSERRDRILTEMGDYLDEVRAKVGAPSDADFCWTGDEDDRPGRCNTEPGTWVVGYAAWQALQPLRKLFIDSVAYPLEIYSWVEAG